MDAVIAGILLAILAVLLLRWREDRRGVPPTIAEAAPAAPVHVHEPKRATAHCHCATVQVFRVDHKGDYLPFEHVIQGSEAHLQKRAERGVKIMLPSGEWEAEDASF